MILLSKAIDVGRDHLIHRKRSPFPYEGKDLTPPKIGLTAKVRRDTDLIAAKPIAGRGGLEGFTPPHH